MCFTQLALIYVTVFWFFLLAVEGFAETDKVIGPILDLKQEYLAKIAANKRLKDIEDAGKWNTI